MHTHSNIHTELQLSREDFSVEYSGGVKGYRFSTAQVSHRSLVCSNWRGADLDFPWPAKAEPLFRGRSTSTDESMMCMRKVKNRMWNELDILCCTSCKAAGAKWSSDVQGEEAKLQMQRKNQKIEEKASLPTSPPAPDPAPPSQHQFKNQPHLAQVAFCLWKTFTQKHYIVWLFFFVLFSLGTTFFFVCSDFCNDDFRHVSEYCELDSLFFQLKYKNILWPI